MIRLQPIETAPLDTPILVYERSEDYPQIAIKSECGLENLGYYAQNMFGKELYWAPLPETEYP